jgi:aspartyl protease family protein
VRALAPLALLLAALLALGLTAPGAPLLGLSHDDFAKASLGVSVLLWLTVSGVARAGPSGAARVLSGALFWALAGVSLVAIYAYRFEFAEIADRVMEELGPSVARVGPGGEVIVRRRLGGEFIVPGTVNGRSVAFVFDTGASSVVLTAKDAAAAGVRVASEDFSVDVTTASGVTTAAPARLGQIAVGGIAVRDVQALVAQPGTLQTSLLGMTFLERLKGFTVENGKLVLHGK